MLQLKPKFLDKNKAYIAKICENLRNEVNYRLWKILTKMLKTHIFNQLKGTAEKTNSVFRFFSDASTKCGINSVALLESGKILVVIKISSRLSPYFGKYS